MIRKYKSRTEVDTNKFKLDIIFDSFNKQQKIGSAKMNHCEINLYDS